MAADEIIGSVSVLISGDYSPLTASFVQAQGVAQKAGGAVAAAFNGGAAAAPGIVDKLGGSIKTAGSASATAAPQVGALAAETASLANSATQAANALVRQASAAHAGVTEIQATSGALRVLEGSGGIRAAERFLTMIPGLGQVLVNAFPIVGAVALATALIHMGEAAYKAGENFLFMKDATESANKIAVQFAGQFVAAAGAMDKIEADLLDRVGKYVEAAQVRIRSLASTPIHLADLLNDKDIKSAIDGFTNQPAWKNLSNLFTDVIPADIPDRIAAINEALKPIETEMANIKRNSIGGFTDPFSQHSLSQDKVEVDLYLGAIELLKKKLEEFKASGGLVNTHAGDKQTTAIAEGVTAQIHAAEEANKQASELEQQRIKTVADANRQIAQIHIDSIHSEAARRDAAAQADVTKAQELRDRLGAEAITNRETALVNAERLRGQESATAKTPLEQQKVGINFDTRVDTANTDYLKTTGGLDKAVADAKDKLTEIRETFAREIADGIARDFSKIGDGWDKLLAQMQDRATRFAEAITRVMEIQDKSKGQTDDLNILTQKLALERSYGLEVIHTAQGRINYETQIAAIENRARQAKIAGLQNALKTAPDDQDPAHMVKRAELEAEIAKLQAESNNASIQANTRILQLKQQQLLSVQLQQSFARAASAVPGAIGGGIAAGVFQHGQGSSIGQEISKALKGIGQQLFGQVLTQLITKMALQAALQAGLITVTSANTAATTANATATGIHAGVMFSHMAVMVGHLAVMVGNTIATAANTIATLIQAALSLFGFADGGSPPVGVPSIVGERGPEIFVPKGAGTIIPNHMIKGYADGAGLDQLPSGGDSYTSSNDTHLHIGEAHFHGVQNMGQMADAMTRRIPRILKAKSSGFSPFSK